MRHGKRDGLVAVGFEEVGKGESVALRAAELIKKFVDDEDLHTSSSRLAKTAMSAAMNHKKSASVRTSR